MFARLVVPAASLVVLLTVGVAPATACEKHLNGHQTAPKPTAKFKTVDYRPILGSVCVV